jgi:hypothetical protein
MVAHSEHVKHHLHLSSHQKHKLLKGDTIQLKPEHLHGGKHEIYLTPKQSRRVKTAMKNHKGLRIQFDSTQRHLHGGSFWSSLKDVGRAIARPVLHTGVDLLAASNPELAPVILPAGHAGVDALGNQAGFGLYHRRRRVVRGAGTFSDLAKSLGKKAVKGLAKEAVKYASSQSGKYGDLVGDVGNALINHVDEKYGGALKHNSSLHKKRLEYLKRARMVKAMKNKTHGAGMIQIRKRRGGALFPS